MVIVEAIFRRSRSRAFEGKNSSFLPTHLMVPAPPPKLHEYWLRLPVAQLLLWHRLRVISPK
jgi:hypothetical protein